MPATGDCSQLQTWPCCEFVPDGLTWNFRVPCEGTWCRAIADRNDTVQIELKGQQTGYDPDDFSVVGGRLCEYKGVYCDPLSSLPNGPCYSYPNSTTFTCKAHTTLLVGATPCP